MPYHDNPDGPPYMSLFSATGGMDLGFDAAGWRCIGQAEWDPWRRSVLRRHWPDIPQWPDVRVVCPDGENDLPETPRLIVGGFPCQDLSLAGKRKGLEGERSGLAFEFIRIVEIVRPEWVLFENVLGLLSSNEGRDLAAILGRMAAIGSDVDGGGYGCAFRVLDAQHFGVPQRRRRVFILCRRSDGSPAAAARSAAEVLSVGTRCGRSAHSGGEEWEDFLSASDEDVEGDRSRGTEPSGTRVTNTITKGATTGLGNTDIVGTMALTEAQIEERERVAGTLLKSCGGVNNMTVASVAAAYDEQREVRSFASGYGSGACSDGDVSPTLIKGGGGGGKGNLVYDQPRDFRWGSGMSNPPGSTDVAGTLLKQEATPAVFDESTEELGVRRFTPLECERLMGWPDDHTRWNDKGEEAPESRRYEACGDGVAAPVATWIGQRLLAKIEEETSGE